MIISQQSCNIENSLTFSSFFFQLLAIDNDPLMCPMEKEQRKRMCLTFSLQNIGSMDKFCKFPS